MDTEPLWALGGWFLFPNCMAATTIKTQTPILATYTKSQHFLLFLAVLFIFLLLSRPAAHPKNPYSPAVSISIKRLLLESSESDATTMNLHPKPTQDLHAPSTSTPTSSSRSSRAKFGVDEHEVPSGPNPISN